MKRITVVTPIYATTTDKDGTTPVVHYFAGEWTRMGYQVDVFHLYHRYPRPYYWMGKLFQHKLNSHFNQTVPTQCPSDGEYESAGVRIHKFGLFKFRLHSSYSKHQIGRAARFISEYCWKEGVPDVFVGHWDNPCLELLDELKSRFNVPTALVFHLYSFHLLEHYHGKDTLPMLHRLDVIGFRSKVYQEDFERRLFKPERSFICYSGVSEPFLKAGAANRVSFENGVNRFTFVGSLIARKYPDVVYHAVKRAIPDGGFSIRFIGDGIMKDAIERCHQENGTGNVSFTGRIPRDAVVDHLKESQCLVMISRGEVFGLVYLEAMALGLIPVASRGEGIDGVIIDGENGFLCEAGNEDELTAIIGRIRNMSVEELQTMSDKAKRTANEFSDKKVAELYLNHILEKN